MNTNNKMFGRFDLVVLGNKKFSGSLTAKLNAESSFKGFISVPPTNTMVGKVDIEDAPATTIYGGLIQDSFTIASNPTQNFGYSNDLLLSEDSTVFLKYHFEPNIDPDYFVKNEDSAKLLVYLRQAYQEPTQGTVYLTSGDWAEGTIRDNYKPTLTPYLNFDLPLNTTGWVTIDLGDLLKTYDRAHTSFTLTLALKVHSNTYSSSPSRHIIAEVAPKLSYTYYHVPPQNRYRQIYGTLTVRIDSTCKFKGLLNVGHVYNDVGFPGTLTPWESGNKTKTFNGSITVAEHSPLPSFDGLLQVWDSGLIAKSFNGLLTPMFSATTAFKGSLRVWYSGLLDNSFNGVLSVLGKTDNRFNGTITPWESGTQAGTFKGLLSVTAENLFKGSIDILRTDKTDSFKGFLRIPSESIFKGSIDILKTDKTNSFNGLLKIPSESTFNGTIDIPKTDRTNSFNGTLKVCVGEQFDGFIDIWRSELQEKLFTGSVVIAEVKTVSFKGTLSVRTVFKNKGYVFIM
jgi:hypothetical protein